MKTTTINADTIEKTETARRVGDTAVHKETVVSSRQVDSKELSIFKINQVVWLGIHIIGVLLLLRFVFFLLGANITGFVATIYALTRPFVQPFQGIFPMPQVSGSYFDSAAILALGMWYLFGFVLTYVISLFSNQIQTEE